MMKGGQASPLHSLPLAHFFHFLSCNSFFFLKEEGGYYVEFHGKRTIIK